MAVLTLLAFGTLLSQKPLLRELDAFPHPDDEPDVVTTAEQLAIFARLRSKSAAYWARLQRGAHARPERRVDPLVSAACAELLAYLRTLVQKPDEQWSQWLRLDRPFAFSSLRIGGRVEIDVDGATPDVINLQLMFLVQQVGIANVRICATSRRACQSARRSVGSDSKMPRRTCSTTTVRTANAHSRSLSAESTTTWHRTSAAGRWRVS
jgi:hypothetical protein